MLTTSTQELIYMDPLVPILQGKTTRRQPQNSAQATQVTILSTFLQKHPTDSIITNFLFFEGLPYLLMKYCVYQFHGLNCCRGRGNIETSSDIKQQIIKFGARGIAITSIHTENEFEKVRDILKTNPL